MEADGAPFTGSGITGVYESGLRRLTCNSRLRRLISPLFQGNATVPYNKSQVSGEIGISMLETGRNCPTCPLDCRTLMAKIIDEVAHDKKATQSLVLFALNQMTSYG